MASESVSLPLPTTRVFITPTSYAQSSNSSDTSDEEISYMDKILLVRIEDVIRSVKDLGSRICPNLFKLDELIELEETKIILRKQFAELFRLCKSWDTLVDEVDNYKGDYQIAFWVEDEERGKKVQVHVDSGSDDLCSVWFGNEFNLEYVFDEKDGVFMITREENQGDEWTTESEPQFHFD